MSYQATGNLRKCSKYTDVSKAGLLHRLKIWKEIGTRLGELASPVLVDELYINWLLPLSSALILFLVLDKHLSDVVLVLDLLHGFHAVLCFGYIKVFIRRLLQEL